MQYKVFLGGTCNGSKWRDKLIENLNCSYYNPVVPDWTEAHIEEEDRAKLDSQYHLYVITPRMYGVYSIAEIIESSNKNAGATLFVILNYDNDDEGKSMTYLPRIKKSLNKVKELAINNGVKCFDNLTDVASFLNAA